MPLMPSVDEMNERLLRLRGWFRWVFFLHREREEQLRELIRGFVILVAVLLANSSAESFGLYERLEWIDLDRIQNSATLNEAKKIFLLMIDDDDYEQQFNGISPLNKDHLTNLIAHVCNSDAGVIAVDIATDHWWKDERYGDKYYEEVVKPKLKEGCHIVWAGEVRNQTGMDGSPSSFDFLGKVVGKSEPPPNLCLAVPVFPRDSDWVVRHYQPWVWVVPSSSHSTTPKRVWTIVSALAEYEKGKKVCGDVPDDVKDTEPEEKKIRFSSDYFLNRIPAGLFLEAVNRDPKAFRGRFKDHIVILGVNHKHARDQHVTPLGLIPGPNLIGDAVFTARSAPIKTVSHWVSFVVHVLVGTALLIMLILSRLRWLWATIASILLTGMAAFVLVWQLFNYGGYFFSVLGGLMGVVLAELTNVMWDPIRDMWKGWLSEKPTL